MRQNDLLKTSNGDHLRILLYGEEQSYVVNCQRCKMPFSVSTPSLLQMERLPPDMYRLFALDEDISDRQRQQRDHRAALISPLMVEECIYDKSLRNSLLRNIASDSSVTRKTILRYLWLYWVYQSKNALLPAERPTPELHELTADEKAIRWALNKFYYTPQRQSLQTAYKMMLRAKYCDAKGRLQPEYPSFWRFRYFFRQHRDPISESISREGIKAYQRNHRPFTGAVSDYAGTIGTYMTDATVADIYIVSRLSRRPIGRPVIYTMVDAYSRLITGVYVESVDSKEVYGVASSNRTVSVRKILQLACFLGLSLSDLLSPPPEDNTLAEIREMYQQGISMYHIAQLYGTDRKTIARWVKP